MFWKWRCLLAAVALHATLFGLIRQRNYAHRVVLESLSTPLSSQLTEVESMGDKDGGDVSRIRNSADLTNPQVQDFHAQRQALDQSPGETLLQPKRQSIQDIANDLKSKHLSKKNSTQPNELKLFARSKQQAATKSSTRKIIKRVFKKRPPQSNTVSNTTRSPTSKKHRQKLIFNASMTIQDYLNSPRRRHRPSKVWLRQCAQILANDTSLVKPFEILREDYALGDCMKRCVKCSFSSNVTTDMPTMAMRYHQLSCPTIYNWTAVSQILEEFGHYSGFVKPPPDAMVIHLRLGDVVEQARFHTSTMLTRGAWAWHSQKNHYTILSVNEYIDRLLRFNTTSRKVVIIGGSHMKRFYRKSRVYAHCLQRGLAKAGFDTSEMYLDNGDADRDFYYMAHAKHFVVTTGGFSMFVGKMVQFNGGETIAEFRPTGLDAKTGQRNPNITRTDGHQVIQQEATPPPESVTESDEYRKVTVSESEMEQR